MVYTAYLMLGKNAANENVWLCRHCNKPADHTQALQGNPEQLIYMLMCPGRKITLGEWATLEEKTAQLSAYIEKLTNY